MQVVPLSAAGIFDYVEIKGPDAFDFLQGQVTCDLQQLTSEHSLPGAICNIKGRVIADFRLLLLAEEHILMQTSTGMAQVVVDTLSRYAVFSKVEIALAPGPQAVYGVIGEAANRALHEQFPTTPGTTNSVLWNGENAIFREAGSEPRFQIWCLSAAAEEQLLQLDAMEETAALDAWKQAEIQAGQIHISNETSEQYTPQLLNYDLSGIVDFEKGCYTGQEVVARMFYRSKAKKRLYKLRSSQTIPTGNFAEADILAVATSADGKQVALGIVKTELAGEAAEVDFSGDKMEVSVEELNY